MILKGSQRAGAAELGQHLLKAENEHVELHEIRGFVADNVVDALREAEAVSRGTRCRQYLFSLSLSPPEAERVPIKAFEDAIAAVEAKVGLAGQPRIVLFHEKEGRRHAHCVWSRIDTETMKAVNLPHYKLKLCDVSQALYLEHGWQMPKGLIDSALRDPLTFSRAEWQQARRAKQEPRLLKAMFRQCWTGSDTGQAFGEALKQHGFHLARGDRRGIVAVDARGEVYAAARWAGIRTKELNARLPTMDHLPAVAGKQAELAKRVAEKLTGFADEAAAEFNSAVTGVEAKRAAMAERHRTARLHLKSAQDARRTAEALQRSARLRTGLKGLWDRVTGQHGRLRQQNEEEVRKAAARDAQEKQLLVERQLEERQRLQREIVRARRVHAVEAARLQRERLGYQRLDGGVPEHRIGMAPDHPAQGRRTPKPIMN